MLKGNGFSNLRARVGGFPGNTGISWRGFPYASEPTLTALYEEARAAVDPYELAFPATGAAPDPHNPALLQDDPGALRYLTPDDDLLARPALDTLDVDPSHARHVLTMLTKSSSASA